MVDMTGVLDKMRQGVAIDELDELKRKMKMKTSHVPVLLMYRA